MIFRHLSLPCIGNLNALFSVWFAHGIRQRRLERSVRRTVAIWRQRFPRWINSGFDEYFLLHDALPLLAGAQRPDPAQLARKWVVAYGIPAPRFQRAVAEVAPVAEDFLSLLESVTGGRS